MQTAYYPLITSSIHNTENEYPIFRITLSSYRGLLIKSLFSLIEIPQAQWFVKKSIPIIIVLIF